MLDSITQPLKLLVSDITTWLLSAAGYPITQVGVTIYIAQYQLLVEDACAGLNSLISLTAVGLFYIYLMHNASWRYSALLLALLLPIALPGIVTGLALLAASFALMLVLDLASTLWLLVAFAIGLA